MKKKTPAYWLIALLMITAAVSAMTFETYFALSSSGRKIDVFTQKEPFNGKGPNEPSDSFQPQEEVILYALVTYNEYPVQNKLVAFQVDGPSPPQAIDPIRIILTAATNESGIASVSFRIPTPIEDQEIIVIGEWFVIATVDIAGVVVNDTLTFRVDYGVKIISIKTLNKDLVPQTKFLRLESVFFDITLENTGLTSKIATISIDAYDSSNTPIIHQEIDGTILNPGQNKIQLSSQIPIYSKIGEAKVYATAYTAPPGENGVPYSPAATTKFLIVTRDIAVVSVKISNNIVRQGDTVNITTRVKNKGNETESFYVSAFYNQTLITKEYVKNLQPLIEVAVDFYWNTSGIQQGAYVITCIADPVEGEIETEDNILKDGVITVLPPLSLIIHDIAINNITIQPREVEIGQIIKITTQIINLGQEPESFNLTLYYNGFNLTTFKVTFLAPGQTLNITYLWDTSNMMEGNYTIKGVIPQLEGEENVENNQFIGGKVWIKAPQIPAKKHDVAVTSLNLSKTKAYKGEDVTITVQVLNLGDFDETFPLSLYANESLIWSYTVKDLGAGKGKSYSFTLKTVNLKVGHYVIWAKAGYVIGETNTENNILIGETLTILEPPVHYIHDIAIVYVQPCSYSVYIGQKLNITVTVKNLGNATESFNLTLYYDVNILQKIYVVMLPPHTERTILFVWDTVDTPEGTYRLKAYAEPVLGEENVNNNVFEDGVITVLKPPPFIVHDVGVIGLYPEKLEVNVGETINVIVVVANLGNVPENVNLTLYYDSKAISTTTTDLTPYTTKELTIKWCTANLKPGKYLLSAKVSAVDGEVNLDNNTFIDGEVTIKPIFVASLFLLILPILILLAIVIFAIVFYYLWRKRTLKFKPQIVIISRPRI